MVPNYPTVRSEFIDIDAIDLDFDNPRIARVLEMYPKREDITAEQISLALGTDNSEKSHTTFTSLKESIKQNQGIIHPIIVNQIKERYVVIEGNTRVQIYKDFKNKNVPGPWDKIMAVIYENISAETAHAIRLQSHLVGPRDWDAYSKGKYLYYLDNSAQLPFNQIVDFCGGDRVATRKYIEAYRIMEEYYRPLLNSDDEFEQEKFSAFIEVQNGRIKQALSNHRFTLNDFASWIKTQKIPQLNKVRQLPAVLNNPKAKQAFINGNIDDAIRILDSLVPAGTVSLKDVPLDELAVELSKKIREMQYDMLKNYKTAAAYVDKKARVFEAFDLLKEFCEDINGEE